MEEFFIIKYYFQLQLAIQLSALIVNTFEKALGAKPKDNVQTITISFILQYKDAHKRYTKLHLSQ